MSYLVKAIKKLKPEAEFSFINEDYQTVKWDKLQGDAPTIDEINVAIDEVKAEEAQKIADEIAKKKAAEAKLVALGLTTDDLKALGLA